MQRRRRQLYTLLTLYKRQFLLSDCFLCVGENFPGGVVEKVNFSPFYWVKVYVCSSTTITFEMAAAAAAHNSQFLHFRKTLRTLYVKFLYDSYFYEN